MAIKKKAAKSQNLYYDPINDTYRVIEDEVPEGIFNYGSSDPESEEEVPVEETPALEEPTPVKKKKSFWFFKRKVQILGGEDEEDEETADFEPPSDTFSAPKRLIPLVGGGLLMAAAMVGQIGALGGWLMGIGTVLVGLPIFFDGIKSLLSFDFNEFAMITLAVVASIALAIVSGNPLMALLQAAIVTILFRLGAYLQAQAVTKAQHEVDQVLCRDPFPANCLDDSGEWVTAPATEIEVGSTIRILVGETVPLDCEMISGKGNVNFFPVNGEKAHKWVTTGTFLPAGAINVDGLLHCRTLAEFEDCDINKVGRIVQQALEKKGSHEQNVHLLAKLYTPFVLVLGIMAAVLPPLLGLGSYEQSISRALVFLVAACPYALLISVPLIYFSGVTATARRGIVVKGSRYLEALAQADCIVFAKTGVLTQGAPTVSEMIFATGVSREDSQQCSSLVEKNSNHPIAKAIVKYSGLVDLLPIIDFTEVAGKGVSASIGDKQVLCGSHRFLNESGIDTAQISTSGVCLSINGKLACGYSLTDFPREDAMEAILKLRALKIPELYLLTGDSPRSAYLVAEYLGLNKYYAELQGGEKAVLVGQLRQKHKATLFVGDAITDSSVLAAADAGIALSFEGGSTSEAATILMTRPKLTAIPDAIELARKTLEKVHFSVAIALAAKAIVLLLALFGLAGMWLAVVVDIGVSLISLMNSTSMLASGSK